MVTFRKLTQLAGKAGRLLKKVDKPQLGEYNSHPLTGQRQGWLVLIYMK